MALIPNSGTGPTRGEGLWIEFWMKRWISNPVTNQKTGIGFGKEIYCWNWKMFTKKDRLDGFFLQLGFSYI